MQRDHSPTARRPPDSIPAARRAASSDPNKRSTVSSGGQSSPIRSLQSPGVGGRPRKKAKALSARTTPGRVHVTLPVARRPPSRGSGKTVGARPQRRQVSPSSRGRSQPQSRAMGNRDAFIDPTRDPLPACRSRAPPTRARGPDDHHRGERDRLSRRRRKLLAGPGRSRTFALWHSPDPLPTVKP